MRGGSDRLCDAMVVHGDESAVAARVAEHCARPAPTTCCLQVIGDEEASVPKDDWRRLAAAVAR